MLRVVSRVLAVTAASAILASCQFIGPKSIAVGRDAYNEVIQETSKEQTLGNIVRVYQHEQTLFMDVTEVDATAALTGQLTGGGANIGAKPGTSGGTLAGRTGSAGLLLQYSETPTVRYVPLIGQALVDQLVQPISMDSLAALTDSDWSPAPVLNFSISYLTPDYKESYLALNTILQLNDMDALEFVAGSSELTKSKSSEKLITASHSTIVNVETTPSKPAAKDTLIIYLMPFLSHQTGTSLLKMQRRALQLWVRLLRIYRGTQPAPEKTAKACGGIHLKSFDTAIDKLIAKPGDYARISKCLRPWIELRSANISIHGPVPGASQPKVSNPAPTATIPAPTIKTRSALGILKALTERPDPLAELVTPGAYLKIINHPWNKAPDVDPDQMDYYTLLPSDEDSYDCTPPQSNVGCDTPQGTASERASAVSVVQPTAYNSGDVQSQLAYIGNTSNPTITRIAKWISLYDCPNSGVHASELLAYDGNADQVDTLTDDNILMNQALGHLRRYILIIVSDEPPGDSYTEYYERGKWYYIVGDDEVSQKNFYLVSLFLTMMAAPPQTSPLTPTINVGG